MRCERLAKECLRSFDASGLTELEVDRAALLVHGAIQIAPTALDQNVSFVNAPRPTDRARETTPAFLELGVVTLHPAHDGRMGYADPALSHHGNQIAVAELLGDVPAHAQNDELRVELAFQINLVSC